MSATVHLQDELLEAQSKEVAVDTRYGRVRGGRAKNGCAVFLGRCRFRAVDNCAHVCSMNHDRGSIR